MRVLIGCETSGMARRADLAHHRAAAADQWGGMAERAAA